MNFRGRLFLSDGGAYLEHVGAEHLSGTLEVISVILHEGRSTGETTAHHLDRAHESCGFPISFSAKAISVRHKTLHGDSGKLPKAMQVFESVCESVRPGLLEEVPQADLDPGRVLQGLTMATAFAQTFVDAIGLVVLSGELIHLGIRHLLNGIGEISHAVSIDGIAELDLSADLVAFRDRDTAHVVAKADDLQSLRIMPCTGSAEPCASLRLHLTILPEANNDLPFQTHAR